MSEPQPPEAEPPLQSGSGSHTGAWACAFSYVIILALAFWLRHDFRRAQARAMEGAAGWSEQLLNSDALAREVISLNATALELILSADQRPLRFAAAQRDLTAEVARERAAAEREPDTVERDTLIKYLEALATALTAVTNEVQLTLRDPGAGISAQPSAQFRAHLRALDTRGRDALSAAERLRDHVRSVAALRSGEQAAIGAHIARLDYFLHVLLLVGLGFAALLVYRLVRQVRRDGAEQARLTERLREADANSRSIVDSAFEGIFQATPQGRFITANKALARMYGYKSPAHLIETFSEVGTQVYLDQAERDTWVESMGTAAGASNFEFEFVRSDGRMTWFRENVHVVRDEEGRSRYIEGTLEDISDDWWIEQRSKLQSSTLRVLSESATVAEARPRILQTICEILEWDMGAVWDVDEERRLLECVEIWHKAEVDILEFDAANTSTTYARGKGLAGEVWQTGEPKWIANLSEADFPNAIIAIKAGMGSAFGVPIKVQGEVRHVLEFFSPKVALPDPELLQTLGMISAQLGQLIERKNAEEGLRKSEMRKAAILHSALDCIISFDSAGKITEFNPAAERAFGYRAQDVVGADMVQLIIPETLRESQRRGIELYKETDGNIGSFGKRMELTATRSDGEEFPAELGISRIVIDGKTMFTAYLRDITDRKDAERITSELAAVVANSTDAIIACTLEGVIRSWNVGAERIYGYTAEEAVGRSLHMLLPPDRLDEFPQTLTAVKRGSSLADYETIRLRKDGRKISVSLTESPIRGDAGKITGLSSIARDTTERKRLEQDLLQSQKMEAVGRLAGGIAHDFNNILTAILGYSDLIISQIDSRQWMYKHLTEIRKAGEFAASLTHQLLAFSRRQPLFLRVFHVNDTVRSMQKMLQRVIGEQIKIKTVFHAQIGRLKADPTQLEQVLLNLCVNARDAMATKGGTITIKTEDVTYFLDDTRTITDMPAGEYVKLSVSDTGVGMSPEVIKHIFEPFFTTKEKEHGTGLGLATCYGIIKQSGGYIGVESIPGSGTTFAIYMPRVEASGEKSTIRKKIDHLPGGSETILYVEDENSVRSLTAHVLRRLGYTVLEANDGQQARAIVEGENGRTIDLLFSDVVLPDLGGKELSDWVQMRSDQTKILFCSGYVDDTILRGYGFERGVAFLQKPFTPSDLAKKVREVIEAKAAEPHPV